MSAVKPPTTYEEQLKKLQSRGCIVSNQASAIAALSKVNYYRLTAYFLPFKNRDDSYIQGTDFDTVYRIYEFDRKLRHLFFSAIEEIEIFLRSTMAYYHAHAHGALGYLDSAKYNPRHNPHNFLEKIKAEKDKRKKEPFIDRRKKNYGDQLPVWVIIEIFSFGMLSFFYSDLPTHDQKEIARTFFNTHPKTLRSWLKCCTDIRNCCAHFGRMYYKTFSSVPDGIPELDQTNNRSLFAVAMLLKSLYADTTKWNTDVLSCISSLFHEHGSDIQLRHIGFPVDWELKLRK